jgi:hypothetical protein
MTVMILHITIEHGAFRDVLLAFRYHLTAPDAAVILAGDWLSFR